MIGPHVGKYVLTCHEEEALVSAIICPDVGKLGSIAFNTKTVPGQLGNSLGVQNRTVPLK